MCNPEEDGSDDGKSYAAQLSPYKAASISCVGCRREVLLQGNAALLHPEGAQSVWHASDRAPAAGLRRQFGQFLTQRLPQDPKEDPEHQSALAASRLHLCIWSHSLHSWTPPGPCDFGPSQLRWMPGCSNCWSHGVIRLVLVQEDTLQNSRQTVHRVPAEVLSSLISIRPSLQVSDGHDLRQNSGLPPRFTSWFRLLSSLESAMWLGAVKRFFNVRWYLAGLQVPTHVFGM